MAEKITKIILVGMMNKKIEDLYMQLKCADIILWVEGEKINGHRSIIAAQCEYFEHFFSKENELNKDKTEFELNVPLEAFKIILKYFYTGQINLVDIAGVEVLIQVIDLVEMYLLFYLKPYFENYCIQILSVENSCRLLEVAIKYELKKLENESFNLIEKKSDAILESESFKNVPIELLEVILTKETFCASSELCVFNAVCEWSKQSDRNIETVMHLLNLPEIPSGDVIKIRNLGTLTAEKLFDAIEKQRIKTPIKRAGVRKLNQNVALSEYNARTIDGYMTSELLNGNSTLYDETKGYTRHTITKANDKGIIVELGKIFSINHLKILLWDRDDRSYSYFIEISKDKNKWERIIDYSIYLCRSWQDLYFLAKNVKYIKIVGTYCSKNSYFDVVTLKAYYTKTIPEIRDGFIVPKNNVALLTLGAIVLEGEDIYEENSLINGDPSSGITCGNDVGNSILIKLNQPYYINSIKLLFDGQGSTKYKFYITTSLNNTHWDEVVNKRNAYVQSWQSFNFSSKAVLFIKIVGTGQQNSYNYYGNSRLSIQHFECYSEDELNKLAEFHICG